MTIAKGNMPPGITLLYCVSMLITFSYAILYSSLALYLTNTLHFLQSQTHAIVGLFIASNFALHLLAGYLGGNFLSNRSLFLLSTSIETLALYLLSIVNFHYLYLALALFVLGCGLNATNINCLLTQKFQKQDVQRENAFFMNYCVSNIGFFAGFMASGYFDLLNNYPLLFGLCIAVNFLSLALFTRIWKYFPEPARNKPKRLSGILLLASCLPLLYFGFYQSALANNLILSLGALMFCFILYTAMRQPAEQDKNRFLAFLILTLFSLVFWTLYFVTPMGFTYFLKNNIDAFWFGMTIPPQWIMNLNTIFVIVGSPLCILLLTKLRSRRFFISIAKQFWLSLVFISLSFFVLSAGIHWANPQGLTSIFWIFAHFLLQALGELMIGPVGYAMIGKLVPDRYQGQMMGVWMMVSGVAATLSQQASIHMTRSESLNPLFSNSDYLHSFNQLGGYALLAALPLYFLIPTLDRYISNAKLTSNETVFV